VLWIRIGLDEGLGSVSDPKRLFLEPNPTLKEIPDPGPILQVPVFPDPIPDPSQNSTFLPSPRKFFFEIIHKC